MISFTYPLFLWGLPVLVLPLLLHILNRRRPKTLTFPVVRFLFLAQLPREGHRRLKDLLVLLLRLTMLAAALLLMARPVWRPKAEGTDERQKRALFVLDCSSSMSGWGHWEKALKLMSKEWEALDGWEKGIIASAGGVLKEIPPDRTLRLEEALVGLSPVNQAGDHRDAVVRGTGHLAGIQEGRLYLVSDFRRNDWASSLQSVPETIHLHFLDCGEDGEKDAGILSVQTSLLPQQRRRVMVSVRNHSWCKLHRTLSVQLGSDLQKQSFDIPPYGQHQAAFAFGDSPDVKQGQAWLEADDYPANDAYPFSTAALPRPKALILAGGDDQERSALAAFFAGRAMASGGIADGFDVTLLAPLELLPEDLQETRVVFILGCLEQLSEECVAKIAGMVSNGGVLFVTPGNGSSSWTCRRLVQTGLLAARANGVAEASRGRSMGIGWIAPDSPLGHLYEDWTESDAFIFPIARHLRLVPQGSTNVLIRSLEEQPLLLSQSLGKGVCYLFAFGFELNWSSFPLTSSFLPILRELARGGLAADNGVRKARCGELLLDKDGKAVDTTRPCVTQLDGLPLEIHLPPGEGITERIDVEDLRASMQTRGGASSTAAPTDADQSRALWHWAAWLLALAALAEAALRLR